MSLDEWLGVGIPEDTVEKAIEWVARLDGTELPETERAEFFSWLDEAPEHQWAYEEISEAWSKLHGLREVADILHRSQVVHFPSQTASTFPITAPESSRFDLYSALSWSALALVAAGLFSGIAG
jgi:ferric-dicitrate binding protein FerR (iron transport regulator)